MISVKKLTVEVLKNDARLTINLDAAGITVGGSMLTIVDKSGLITLIKMENIILISYTLSNL